MNLRELLAGHDHVVLQGDPSVDVTGDMSYDSRKLNEGSLFIAVAGRHSDGHRFLPQAAERKAVAALITDDVPEFPPELCVVRVDDTRAITPVVASRYFDEPGRTMDMVAVTGTNGKTSVSFMVEAALRVVAGTQVGVIGTAGLRVGDSPVTLETTTPTTPEAIDLQRVLAHMRKEGAAAVVMEASSMALAQHRVDCCFIDIGVFTNFTQDHLDDHGTMANYKAAKLRLFAGLCEQAVVNADDPVAEEITALMPGKVLSFGIDARDSDLRATDVRVDAEGTRFTLRHDGRAYEAFIPVPGRFAVANALATAATCHLLGHDLESVMAALSKLPPTPGRFESYRTLTGVSVIVDYAHSADALDNVLSTIRGFAPAQVITVFGCGGDRDPTKRAPMGQVAGEYSDLCVLTSDNPRSEDPETILQAIVPGVATTDTPYIRIADRREAIRHALKVAQTGDVVLVAGKGSENYQLIGEQVLPFDDMATVRELADELVHQS